jgi:acetyltransferase-like isoleucine patch superfamily enzyme
MIRRLKKIYNKHFCKVNLLNKFSSIIDIKNSVLQPNFNISAPFATNRKYLKIGSHSMLDCKIYFESSSGLVEVGDNVFIGSSTIICRSSIIFENNIFIAWGTYFYDHDSHSLDYRERRLDLQIQWDDFKKGENFIANKNWDVVNSKPIHVCSDAWIGMNCIILKGVRIGRGAIVAAGSVVTKDVPDWTVVAGNPAKVVKQLEIKE